ncbi:unnamed protein product [Rotaria magnacalcarata]|nr:unnamed protein product [Rotaria magnacalcarata]CAF5182956.1 unnamed protein product [Rotaria magnacalcarata]
MIFLLTSAEMKKFIDQNENESFDEKNQYSSFQSIIKDLILPSIDQTEFALLKLIIIFSIPTHFQSNDRFLIDKYRKDALFMLTEYTKNSKYRRLAELLMLLSHMQETMSTIYLDKIFFQHLLHRISMKNLLCNIIRHIRTFFR